MIREIEFEEIKEYWNKLWSEFIANGYIIRRVNTTTQKDYFYRVITYLNQEQIESMIKPTFIGYFIDGTIVAVESGYKTNIDYYRIRGLWVDEKYRRAGIATELVNWFEQKCKEKFLWTVPRENALKFYLQYGFEVTGLSDKTVYGQNYFAVKEVKND